MKNVIVLILLLTSSLSFAQSRTSRQEVSIGTQFVDLESGFYMPVSNCEIFYYREDFNRCETIKQFARNKADWHEGGYAINCMQDISNRSVQDMCREISRYIQSDSSTINCSNTRLGFGLELERCFAIQNAYNRGYFEQTIDDCYDCSVETAPEIIVPRSPTVHELRQQCYDNAYNQWLSERERRRQQGAGKAIAGTGLAIIGSIIAGASDSDAGRVAGTVLTGVGATVATYGLFEMASADFMHPYQMEQCRSYYQTEVRYVTIERQRCTTTRYYTQEWGRTYEYFETRCSSKTYYSFERNPNFWM